MKQLVVSIVSAAALATAGMAAANSGMDASDQDFSNNNNAGIFLSGDVGAGFVGLKKSDYAVALHKFRDYGFAWAANLGYQFNKYLALEAGYMTFGQAKATATTAGATATRTDKFGGFDVAAKGIIPVSSQFNLFGKVGAVNMHDDVDVTANIAGSTLKATGHTNTWVPMIGAGTAFNVSKNVALTVQDDYAFRTNYTYKGVKTFMPAANDVLAGMTYKFNA